MKYNYNTYMADLQKAIKEHEEEQTKQFFDEVIKSQEPTPIQKQLYDDLNNTFKQVKEDREQQIKRAAEEKAEKEKQKYLKEMAKKGLYDDNPELTKALKEIANATPYEKRNGD